MKTEVFDVQGMTCSACVGHVEKAVNKIPGIFAVRVNLLTNSMMVRYDEYALQIAEIEKTVSNAGYKAVSRTKIPELTIGVTSETSSRNKNIDPEVRKLQTRWVTSLLFLIPLLYISMGEMMHVPVPVFLSGHENVLILVFLQFLLTIPVYLLNKNYFIHGFKSLFRAAPNMDSLIAIGSAAAFIYGIFAIFSIGYGLGHGNHELVKQFAHDVYFESGATILTLITLGKYLEVRSKSRTTEALTALMDLAPKTAWLMKDDQEQEVAIEQVHAGDVVVVKSGWRIPVDGEILTGNATIDESMLTGESLPVFRQSGEKVYTATVNKSGYLTIRAEKTGEDTTMAHVIQLVEEASSSKAPISKLADRISAIFVPVVIVIALLATGTWLLLGYPFTFALSIGISVLVISCPCALGLATPVAIMVGTGRGAKEGILVKSAEAFETAAKTDTVVLDKTGTLTEGKPMVTRILTNRFFAENKLLEIAASLENLSEHPLAEAILEEAAFREIKILPADNFSTFPGMGVKASVNERFYLAGNLKMMEEQGVKTGSFPEKAALLAAEGASPLYIANATEVLGVIGIADVLKTESAEVVAQLKAMRLNVVMLTGDLKTTAQAIQHKLGIEMVRAELLPHEKEQEIRKLQLEGHTVAMVGDGINDAPSLTRANLGIAIGAGTDIAMDSADIVLVGRRLSGLVSFIRLSREVMLNIRQNLFWAFFYNILGIPLAAGLFYNMLGWKLNPMFAAAAMSLSSVTVVLNALRLRKAKKY